MFVLKAQPFKEGGMFNLMKNLLFCIFEASRALLARCFQRVCARARD